MQRTRCLLFSIVAIGLSALGRAQDPVVEIVVSPGNGSLVTAPAHLRLVLSRGEHTSWTWLRGETLHVLVDGRDVTAGILQRAIAAGSFEARRDGMELAVTDPLPLSAGRHVFEVRLENRWGYVYRLRTDCEVLARAMPPPQHAPAPVTRVDNTPPTLELDPGHLSFRNDASADLVVHYADELEGVDVGTLTLDLDGQSIVGQAAIHPDRAIWTPTTPIANGRHVLRASASDYAGNRRTVSSTFVVFDRGSKYPWFFPPVNQPHPLAHTHHQFQQYSANPSGAYFHHGVDIREPSGTPLYVPVGGVVTNAAWYGSQPLYFEVAVRDPDGFLWEYHHVDEPTVPQAIKQAAQTGGSIPAGTYIGSIVYWPVRAYGQRFHHVHLNVKDPDGRYVNPLHLLTDIRDTLPPACLGVWVMPNLGSTSFTGNPPTVRGDVDVVARFEDLTDGQPYQLTLYWTELEIRELGGTHGLGPVTLWKFDNLPGGSSRSAGVWDVFKQSFTAASQSHSTQGDYNDRRFYYVMTNTLGGRLDDASGYWDTDAVDSAGRRSYPNGIYRITVRAWDILGNPVSRHLDVRVQN